MQHAAACPTVFDVFCASMHWQLAVPQQGKRGARQQPTRRPQTPRQCVGCVVPVSKSDTGADFVFFVEMRLHGLIGATYRANSVSIRYPSSANHSRSAACGAGKVNNTPSVALWQTHIAPAGGPERQFIAPAPQQSGQMWPAGCLEAASSWQVRTQLRRTRQLEGGSCPGACGMASRRG